MKRVKFIDRDQENVKYIVSEDDWDGKPIFAKRDGVIRGMIIKEEQGYTLRSPGGG